jgi:hypothetical protein
MKETVYKITRKYAKEIYEILLNEGVHCSYREAVFPRGSKEVTIYDSTGMLVVLWSHYTGLSPAPDEPVTLHCRVGASWISTVVDEMKICSEDGDDRVEVAFYGPGTYAVIHPMKREAR